jgi:hypothetical protein
MKIGHSIYLGSHYNRTCIHLRGHNADSAFQQALIQFRQLLFRMIVGMYLSNLQQVPPYSFAIVGHHTSEYHLFISLPGMFYTLYTNGGFVSLGGCTSYHIFPTIETHQKASVFIRVRLRKEFFNPFTQAGILAAINHLGSQSFCLCYHRSVLKHNIADCE